MNSIYLEMEGVLDQLEAALLEHRPLSLVRVGDGENIVMSQETVWPTEQVLQERWAKKANLGQRDFVFPTRNYGMKSPLPCNVPISWAFFLVVTAPSMLPIISKDP